MKAKPWHHARRKISIYQAMIKRLVMAGLKSYNDTGIPRRQGSHVVNFTIHDDLR